MADPNGGKVVDDLARIAVESPQRVAMPGGRTCNEKPDCSLPARKKFRYRSMILFRVFKLMYLYHKIAYHALISINSR